MASLICNNFKIQMVGVMAGGVGVNRLYVNHTTGKDSNTGLLESEALLTIGAATAKAVSNTEIRISGGSYAENILIDNIDKVRLIGESRDGVNMVRITPASGKALEVDAQEFEASGIGFIGADTNVIQITGTKNVLRNIYLEAGANNAVGIVAIDADELLIEDLYADGKNKNNVIGVLFTGDTVDAILQKSYLTEWGSGIGGGTNVGYAVGRNNTAHRIAVMDNKLISNWIGMYWYAPVGATALEGDFAGNNTVIDNQSYDFWDEHEWPVSANLIDGNFYGYSISATENWYDDYDGDGIADFVARCGPTNRDRHPRTSPLAKYGVTGVHRRSVI
jgi:hypothetical protein